MISNLINRMKQAVQYFLSAANSSLLKKRQRVDTCSPKSRWIVG